MRGTGMSGGLPPLFNPPARKTASGKNGLSGPPPTSSALPQSALSALPPIFRPQPADRDPACTPPPIQPLRPGTLPPIFRPRGNEHADGDPAYTLPPIQQLPGSTLGGKPKPEYVDPLEAFKAQTHSAGPVKPGPEQRPPIKKLQPLGSGPMFPNTPKLPIIKPLKTGLVFTLPTAGPIEKHPYQGTLLEGHFSANFKFDISQLKGPDPVGSVQQWSANLNRTMNEILTVNKAETRDYKALMTQVLVVDNGSIYLKDANGKPSGKPLGTLAGDLSSIWNTSDSNYSTDSHQTVRNNVYKQVSDVARHSVRVAVHVVVEAAESLRADFGKMMADETKLHDAKSALDRDIDSHLAKGVMVDNFAERTKEISDLQAQVSAKYAQSEAQITALGSLIKTAKNFETKVEKFSKEVDKIKAEVTTFNDEAAAYTTKLTAWAIGIDTQKAAFSEQKDAFVESNQAFNVTLSLREFPLETPGVSSPSSSPAEVYPEKTFSSTRGKITKTIFYAANSGYYAATSHKGGVTPARADTSRALMTPKTPQEIQTMALLAVAQHPAMAAFDTRYTSLSTTLKHLNSQIKLGLDDLGKQYQQLQPTQSALKTSADSLTSERETLNEEGLKFNEDRTGLENGLKDLRASMEALEKALLKPNSGEADVTIKSTLESRNVEISALNLKIESFKKMSDEFKEKHPSLGNLSCLPAAVNTMVDRINVVIQAYSGIGGVRSDVKREGSDLVPRVNAFHEQAGEIEPPDALPLVKTSTKSLSEVPSEPVKLPNAQFSISPLVAPTGEAVAKPIVVPMFDIVAAEFNAEVKLNLLDSTTFTMNGVFSKPTDKLALADHMLNTREQREAAIREGLSTTVTPPDSGRLKTLLTSMNNLKNSGIAFMADGKDVTEGTLLDHYKNQIGIRIETSKDNGDPVTVTVVSAVGMDKYLEAVERKIEKLDAGIENREAEKKAVTDASQLISTAIRMMYREEPCPKDMADKLSPSLAGAQQTGLTGLTGKLFTWLKGPLAN